MTPERLAEIPATDKQKFLDLFEGFGIPLDNFGHDDEPDGEVFRLGDGYALPDHRNGKIDGYFGFYGSFHFDASGKFVKVGFWE